MRTKGITNHIRKELQEIEDCPDDLEEWVDVIILGLNEAWRAGYSFDEIITMIEIKQAKNEARQWPDYRNYKQDEEIEHIK